MITPIRWEADRLLLLDQTLLPVEERVREYTRWRDVAESIRSLVVRGAPAIGCAAAFGVALAARESRARDGQTLLADLEEAFKGLAATRPTAVNLFWALDRMRAVASAHQALPVPALQLRLLGEAQAIFEEDLAANHALGAHGADLVPEGARILTHCNAGALATAGYGTAVGVIRAAHERGKVALVVTGADRIAANGDTANKIGTYSVAVLARHHGVPFYVAAPFSTIDASVPSGAAIPIEERDASEVRGTAGRQTAPAESPVYNPAFDVTPAELITSIITERGIFRPPYSFT